MKRYISIFLITLAIIINSMVVYANDTWPSEEFQKIENGEIMSIPTDESVDEIDQKEPVFNESERCLIPNNYAGYKDILPQVTIDDAVEWANRKGFEVIHFLQVIVQPFAIIIFIISAFITLIGSIGRGDMGSRGIWGMIASVVIYAVVLYAPIILQTFVGWISA